MQSPGKGICTLWTPYTLCHFTTLNNAYARYTQNICQCRFLHRSCLNIFCHFEASVSHLNGRRLDHRQVKASYASYEWLLLAQLYVHLDVDDSGLLLPVSHIVLLRNRTRKNF
jgi:hypothetical protein